MKKIILIFAFLLTVHAYATVSPSSVKVKVYAAAVSANTDCSNPTVLFSSDTPKEIDMAKKPTIGGGNPPDGTYPCLMIKMSDQIKVVPQTSEGSCVAGTEYTLDVCKATANYTPFDPATATFGTTTACATNSENIVTLYLSTISPTQGSSTFVQPTDTSKGMQLTNAWVISGASVGTFTITTSDKVTGSGASCDMNAPTFGFQ